eukprot:RCo022232
MSDNEAELIEVVEETKQQLLKNPRDVQAHFKQGCAYFNLEEYESAVKVLRDGLALAQQSSKEEDRALAPKLSMWIRKCNTNLSPDKQVAVDLKDPAAVSPTPTPPPTKPPHGRVRNGRGTRGT